jgi:hypothetical protein
MHRNESLGLPIRAIAKKGESYLLEGEKARVRAILGMDEPAHDGVVLHLPSICPH